MTAEDFHKPALMHGWELVSDLKSTELQIQENFEDVIQVGRQ